MKYTIIVIMLIGSLISCEKEEDKATGVNGRVLEYGTNIPLEGIAVILSIRDTPDGVNTTDTAYTDKYGRYSAKVEEFGYIGDLTTLADGYYPFPDLFGINTGQTYTYPDIILDPKGWVKFHVKNVNPQPQSQFEESVELLGPWNSTGVDKFSGPDVDVVVIREMQANRNTYYGWKVKREGNSNIFKTDYYLTGQDTVPVEVYY